MNSLKNLAQASILILLIGAGAAVKAQTIEKLELVLGPPIYNTDRHDGYYYEARGNVYAKGTAFDCEAKDQGPRIGTYRIGVSYGAASEHIASYSARLNDGRNLLWQGYFKFDPNEDGSEYGWAYSGIQTHSEINILTDFTLLSRSCFGGRLVVYFLNGG
jgi:hypothetical protein